MLGFLINLILGILAGYGTNYALKKRSVSEGWSLFWGVVVGLLIFSIDLASKLLSI